MELRKRSVPHLVLQQKDFFRYIFSLFNYLVLLKHIIFFTLIGLVFNEAVDSGGPDYVVSLYYRKICAK